LASVPSSEAEKQSREKKGCQGSHDLKRKKKGKDKKRDRRHGHRRSRK
jgi:hypothetical protein